MPCRSAFQGLPLPTSGWVGTQRFPPRTNICEPNFSGKRLGRSRQFHRGIPFQKLPVALAAAGVASALAEDVLLQFQTSSGARRVGRAVKPDGKRNWIVADANGLSFSVASKQISFILGPSTDFGTHSNDLTSLDEICHQKAAENEDLLQEIWEFVMSEDSDSKATDIEAVTKLVFADEDPLNHYVSHLLMSNDKIYFKEKNIKGRLLYEGRTESQVRDARLMQEAVSAKEEQLQLRRDVFSQAYQERSLEALLKVFTASDVEHLIDGLKSIAMELDGTRSDSRFGSEPQNAFHLLDDRGKQLVREALSALGKSVLPSAAMDLLVTLRVYSKHENLALLKSGICHLDSWTPGLQSHVDELLKNLPEDIDKEIRRDLTHLQAYAIDSADTSEVDDAISWDPDTGRIYVHVADPTRYFPDGPSNPILQEAFRRAVTLYLPHTKFTMFPEELATQVFSLDGIDSDGSAVSFGFRIEDDGSLGDDSITIEPTQISAPIRYTYDDAEAMLSGATSSADATILNNMYKETLKRKYWREMEGGAIIVNNPFAEVTVRNVESNDPDILLETVLTTSKSWTLVSELMITACAVAGEYAQEASIPVPFRGQEPFDYPEDDVLESFPDGPVRAAVAFRSATPSQVHTEPMEHASLGLDAYLQVTSPIRRSTDLVSHFQLKATIRGETCPMSIDEVRKEIARSSDVSRTSRQVESRTKKYWQLEYLRRLGPQIEHEGLYVRPLKDDDSRLGLVYFEQYGFQTVATVPSNAKPGSRLKLRVVEADPRTTFTRIEVSLALTAADISDFSDILEEALSDGSS